MTTGDLQAPPWCTRCGTPVPHPDPRDGTCMPCTNREPEAEREVLAHLAVLLADINASARALETTTTPKGNPRPGRQSHRAGGAPAMAPGSESMAVERVLSS